MTDLTPEMGGAACPIFRNKGRRAVILCDGPAPPSDLIAYWLHGAEMFICTDAAGHPYTQLPCPPDVVIGDFDSLTGRIIEGRDGPRYLQVSDQHTTDSEKALLYAVDQGFTEAVLLGATGWYLDHTLFNVHLLERFADRLDICLAGYKADTIRLGAGSHVSWELQPGTRFSVLPLAGEVKNVTVEGAEFPILAETLVPGGRATIGNRVEMSPLLISVGAGSLMVSVDRESGLNLEFDPDQE